MSLCIVEFYWKTRILYLSSNIGLDQHSKDGKPSEMDVAPWCYKQIGWVSLGGVR